MKNLRGAKIVNQDSLMVEKSHLYIKAKDENYCELTILDENGKKRKAGATWSSIIEKPTTFPPSTHTHSENEIKIIVGTSFASVGQYQRQFNQAVEDWKVSIQTQIDNKANSSDVYKKNQTYSQTEINGFLSEKQNTIGYTTENSENKSNSYTASSSTTYASTKALVDGLETKLNKGTYTGTAQDLKNDIDNKTSDKYNDEPNSIVNDIIKFIDINTGENVNYRETTKWYDGSTMDDNKVDGIIYIKKGVKFYVLVDFTIGLPLNVKWFGAKGNGTDDTIALLKAVDFYNKSGISAIYFPSGNYNINDSLFFQRHFINIIGDGRNSIIIQTGTNKSGMIFYNSEQISIRDLCIYGNGGAEGAGATNKNGIEFSNSHHVKMYNVTILYNKLNGVGLYGGAWCHYYSGCLFSQNGGDGVNSISPSSDEQNGNNLSIINCSILQNAGNGIIWNAASLNLTGNNFENNGNSGVVISTENTILSARGFNIVGNYFESNKKSQIKFINKWSGVAIVSGKISGNFITTTRNDENDGEYMIFGEGTFGSLKDVEFSANDINSSTPKIQKHYNLENIAGYGTIIRQQTDSAINTGLAKIELPYSSKIFSSDKSNTELINDSTKKVKYILNLEDKKVLKNISAEITSDTGTDLLVKIEVFKGVNLITFSDITIPVSSIIGSNSKISFEVLNNTIFRFSTTDFKQLFCEITISNATGSTLSISDLIVEYV